MKKLIKRSDYYYVVDNKAEIKNVAVSTHVDYGQLIPDRINKIIEDVVYFESGCTGIFEALIEVIATTNPLLPLPQITNASDELEVMVGKEVEVNLYNPIGSNGKVDYTATVCNIIPISKETRCNCGALLLKIGDRCHYCNKETSTNETLLKFPSDNLKRLLGKETLEEVATKSWQKSIEENKPNI